MLKPRPVENVQDRLSNLTIRQRQIIMPIKLQNDAKIACKSLEIGSEEKYWIYMCRQRKIPPFPKTKMFSLWLSLTLIAVCHCQMNVIDAGIEPFDSSTLECHRRIYTYQVSQSDANGRQCWDTLSVWACWGRCDSNEIADWRFPYKKSSHPVCVHYGRTRSVAILRHCEEGAHPSAARYEYLEAAGCQCQLCSSSDTSCEGLTYRSHRSHPDLLGFGLHK
ncbi:glycoprotein hormone beta chain [Holotrichia oblita]|uniref:Glycoprotein hormone beta chain n=1 Tax=Holotrichia oblita TaxID=644536 RepID=A0ACB9T1F1_HOLOL|nr:glycoprotein hormone beta chain [Holotrichia oblita]